MFDFFFKYPPAVFAKGEFVLLGGWPVWVLGFAIAAAGAALAVLMWRRSQLAPGLGGVRPVGIWALQTLLVTILLFLLWQPAIRIATLKPQQNVVAVIVDDSRSMALQENGTSRKAAAVKTLESGLLKQLEEKFQIRLYRMGERLERIQRLDQLNAGAPATRFADSLKQVAIESSSLPVGAVVLLSDGADNAGGVDLETLGEIRRHRIPIHTIGFGREKLSRDIEVSDVQVPARALAESRLSAFVTLRQRGYEGRKARIKIQDAGKTLATREITLKPDGAVQTEPVLFNAGTAGARNLQVTVDTLEGEENPDNNSVVRLVNVLSHKPRILYFEGEPRWEFKFIRRAIEEDKTLNLASILRTTQNKIYRQGINSPAELEQGFPSKVEELFAFDGIIIGSVEAGTFTASQQELLKQFVDRRGGGVLFLGGRFALAEGGYGSSALSELMPVLIPASRSTFRRDPATVELTPVGRDSLITRLEEDTNNNAARWKKMPYLADYQEVGAPKAGALVLADLLPTSRGRFPLLVTQNYGRGRTVVLATSGSWRWQMQQPLEDKSHEMFWQQLLRWLVSDTQGRVVSGTSQPVINDDSHVPLRIEVRDKNYLPASDAHVEARILGPGGLTESVEFKPDPVNQGVYFADWSAEKPGSFVAEVSARRGDEEIGRDVALFRREDGVAESFRVEQNRELLEKLSAQTGGRYYGPSEAGKLGEEISYSEAGITVRETRELWNMPAIFLLALMLRSGEWLLRRRWGVV